MYTLIKHNYKLNGRYEYWMEYSRRVSSQHRIFGLKIRMNNKSICLPRSVWKLTRFSFMDRKKISLHGIFSKFLTHFNTFKAINQKFSHFSDTQHLADFQKCVSTNWTVRIEKECLRHCNKKKWKFYTAYYSCNKETLISSYVLLININRLTNNCQS